MSAVQQSLNPGEDIAQGSRVANRVGHHIVAEHPVDAPRGICAVVGLKSGGCLRKGPYELLSDVVACEEHADTLAQVGVHSS
ncbi:hypothetical protein EV644_10617 [Kribbella orskensis]|uniref:Uncharacterized protein n=1 Tax=Kribbella orskensis TaxID=2512216 RepID=A0ABY2BLX8_9ACTN|nr:hypothetical protein EV642_10517 [Kribbella sp. VKM Ac-2500]TCO22710.1 hypothetical protein EV644_10617 [Kribbella orskensis]